MQVLILSNNRELLGEIDLIDYKHSDFTLLPVSRFITHKLKNLCTSEELEFLDRYAYAELSFTAYSSHNSQILVCSTDLGSEIMEFVINKQKQVIKV